ncbi:MAG: hydrogenase maturation protease [Opitutus sp.]|nr:hydrogenase maturation protease [Opitutus sp.]
MPPVTTSPPVPLGAVPSRVLVIGCGNTLFGDDGVGPLVAERIGDWCRPGVLALAVHQLTPELTADLAATELFIFVDASVRGETVECVPLGANDAPDNTLDHALTPGALLALCRSAFGRAPPALAVLVPGEDFTLGHALSKRAQSGFERAVELIAQRL